jgi:hypothetical protein
MSKEKEPMVKRGRSILVGGLCAVLVVAFFQVTLRAEGIEAVEPVSADSGYALPEFNLAAVDRLEPAAVENEAFSEPSPRIATPFVAPRLGGGSVLGNSLFKSTLAMGVALQVADYFLTKEALRYQGAAEGNPLMKGAVKNPYVFAAVKVGASAVSVFLLSTIYKKNKTLGWILSTVTNSLMTYVVLHNYGALRQVKAGPEGR